MTTSISSELAIAASLLDNNIVVANAVSWLKKKPQNWRVISYLSSSYSQTELTYGKAEEEKVKSIISVAREATDPTTIRKRLIGLTNRVSKLTRDPAKLARLGAAMQDLEFLYSIDTTPETWVPSNFIGEKRSFNNDGKKLTSELASVFYGRMKMLLGKRIGLPI